MSRFQVAVYVPTLRSAGRRFVRLHDGLVVSAAELNEELASHRHWPPGAHVVEAAHLGRDEADGETRVRGMRHELVHLVRLHLLVEADSPPPAQAWHPWALKSCVEVT